MPKQSLDLSNTVAADSSKGRHAWDLRGKTYPMMGLAQVLSDRCVVYVRGNQVPLPDSAASFFIFFCAQWWFVSRSTKVPSH